MRVMRPGAASLVFAAALAGLPAGAGEIARSGDWRVFTGETGVRCFAASPAADASPSSVRHGDAFAYVGRTSRGGTQTSFRLAYEPKRLPAPKAEANGRTFDLFVAGREIFARDADEAALADAIRRGAELRLETVHETGVRAAYAFSLRGSAEAVDRVRSGC